MTVVENKGTFLARVEPLLSSTDFIRVQLAYQLAKDYHRNQSRKELDGNGDPLRYFEHIRTVATIVIDDFCIIDADMICAALLHDALEDTDLTGQQIEFIFGQEVSRMVRCLTAIPKAGYMNRLRKFADWKVMAIKLADNLHNCRSMHHGNIEWQKKQVLKRFKIYTDLWDTLLNIQESYMHIDNEFPRVFDKAIQECHEILVARAEELQVDIVDRQEDDFSESCA